MIQSPRFSVIASTDVEGAAQQVLRETEEERAVMEGTFRRVLVKFPGDRARRQLLWNALLRRAALGDLVGAQRELEGITGRGTLQRQHLEFILRWTADMAAGREPVLSLSPNGTHFLELVP